MWLTDQNNALSIFLTYGRDLTPDELESLQFDVDEDGNTLIIPSPPKLVDFKYKVCKRKILFEIKLYMFLY